MARQADDHIPTERAGEYVVATLANDGCPLALAFRAGGEVLVLGLIAQAVLVAVGLEDCGDIELAWLGSYR